MQARVSLLARVAPLPPTEVRCAQALWRGFNRSAAAGRAASAALQPAEIRSGVATAAAERGRGFPRGLFSADGLEVIDACCHAGRCAVA